MESKEFLKQLQTVDLIQNVRLFDNLIIVTTPSGGEYYADLSDNTVGVFQTTDLLMQELNLENQEELERALIQYVQEANTTFALQQPFSFLSTINKYNQWFLRVKNDKTHFTIDLPVNEIQTGDEISREIIKGTADLKKYYLKFLSRHKYQDKFNKPNLIRKELVNYLMFQHLSIDDANKIFDSLSEIEKENLYTKLTSDIF